MNAPRMLSIGAIISLSLAVLLGGVALVVYALSNMDLKLSLRLRRRRQPRERGRRIGR